MKARTLSSLAAVLLCCAASAGCASELEPEDDQDVAAESGLTQKGSSTPVVVVIVDDASRAWIAAERSTVDDQPIGASLPRQREMFVRLQRAINSKALAPKLVHYGYHFTSQDEGRKITDAFAKAIDASPVPVVLEMTSGSSGWSDRAVYHAWSLSNPPNMLVGESLTYSCSDRACSTANMVMTSANPALDGLPVALRAALEMADGHIARKPALANAKKSVGATLPVKTASRGLRVVALKEVLTNAPSAAALEGAAVIVAPDSAANSTTVSLAALKGATMAAVIALP